METCGNTVELTGPDEILTCGLDADGHEIHSDGWTEWVRLEGGLYKVRRLMIVAGV